MAIAVVASLLGIWAFWQSLAEGARADQFFNLITSDPAGERAMQKICLNAIEVTTSLAMAKDAASAQPLEERFWELYFGPMYIVELHERKKSGTGRSGIEAAMVQYGKTLKEVRTSSGLARATSLCPRADAIHNACHWHLKILEKRRPCP
ncbi:MAG: hypothetical protein R3D67_00580 [Hyphomicrobiaceae bacterium]